MVNRQESAISRVGILTSPLFLGCLAVLVTNDLLLKALFHNWLTGKLSDVAGVFLLAAFGTALLPGARTLVHVATAVLFVLFKSPLVQPVIDAVNELGIMQFARVVDYSDIGALVVLPSSWWWTGRMRRPGLGRAPAWAAGAMAVLAFVATSRIEPDGDADTDADVLNDEDGGDDVVLFGSCPAIADVEQAEELPFVGLFHERWSRCSAPTTPVEGMIMDQPTWDEFLAQASECMEDPPPPILIDFDQYYVVVGGHASWETCGLMFDEGRVYLLHGTSQPHVEMLFTDISGAADCASCTAGEGYVVVVAVARLLGTMPTLCRRVSNLCE